MICLGMHCSRGTTPEPTCRTALLAHQDSSSPGSSSCSSPARKPLHQQPIHRSRTGGPLDGGGSSTDSPRTPSPTKSKLNFLEGFRNTLRARSPVRIGSVPVRSCSSTLMKNHDDDDGVRGCGGRASGRESWFL